MNSILRKHSAGEKLLKTVHMVPERAENNVPVRNIFFERILKDVRRCEKTGREFEFHQRAGINLKRLKDVAQLKGVFRVCGERVFVLPVF